MATPPPIEINEGKIDKDIQLTISAWEKDKKISPGLPKILASFLKTANVIQKMEFIKSAQYVLIPDWVRTFDFKLPNNKIYRICCKTYTIMENPKDPTHPVITPTVTCTYYLPGNLPANLPPDCVVSSGL